MDIHIKNLILQSKKTANNGVYYGYHSNKPLLTLLHFSDVHSDSYAMDRLCNFLEEYDDCIDDCICTGDVLESRWISDFNYWGKNERAKSVLSCVGNHDILADDKGWDWSLKASQKDCYKRFFAPFISNWGCVYTEDKTFYYKDYPANAIRLIVINSVLEGQEKEEQLNWLEGVLNDAIKLDLHVVMAMHYPVLMKKIPCNFTTLEGPEGMGTEEMSVYQEKVADFINNGGNFVTWLAGHIHIDYVGYNEKFPNQLCVAIDALHIGQSDAYNDADRRMGMPSEDLYNLVTIDTVEKLVKIVRVGCNVDRFLRKKDTLCINYKTFEVIK